MVRNKWTRAFICISEKKCRFLF
uniref:Uncharacterized protein n=1 Tax=Arundo donax TaxID=35708 RepID=A0A0A9F516_ARUDO